MTPELFRRSRELYGAAVELPPGERAAFLREACGEDEALLEEVEALLGEPESIALADGVDAALRTLGAAAEGTMVGPWEVVREIGRGGMGTVHLARRADGAFERDVALKLVAAGLDSEDFLERFRRERQILASLAHPNIAALLDGGTTPDGLPYLAMEYVDGRRIDSYCREESLPVPDRLKLFLAVCAAVQHSHRNLVVHRDLKPSNVLVTKDGTPKLLDFGLARLLGAGSGAERTATGLRALTPAYASPEQIRGDAVTTATDVYSLGALLYVLLADRPPHPSPESGDVSAVLNAVLTEEPDRPSEAAPGARIPPDLDAIVLKALRKEPDARYGSVDQLARDVERFLEGRPVAARRGTAAYRARKFARRHWTGLAAASLVVVSLVAGLLVANGERRKAERRFEEVRRLANSYLLEFYDAIRDLPGSTAARELVVKRGLEYLDRLSREAAGDRALTRELAEAYQRVGDVQGNPFQPNLGDLRGAVASYHKALALLEPLVASPGATDSDRALLAKASLVGGGILATTGASDEALDLQRRGVALRQALADAAPSDRTRRSDLAQGLGMLGFDLVGNGKAREALEPLGRQESLLRGLLAEEPGDVGLRRALGRSLLVTGEARQSLGDATGAGRVLGETLAIQRALVKERPLNPLLKQDLAFTLGEFATSLSESGQAPASLAASEERLALSRELAAADPKDAAAQLAVAFSLHSVGEALVALDRPEEALEEYAEAERLYDRVIAADPADTWAALHRAWLDTTKGRARDLLARRRSGAVAAHERARACELFGKSAAALEDLDRRGQLPKIKRSYLDDARGERDTCGGRATPADR